MRIQGSEHEPGGHLAHGAARSPGWQQETHTSGTFAPDISEDLTKGGE